MVIKFLTVEKCCCYLPLASGAKFFGFLSLTGGLFLLIFGGIDFVHLVMWSQDADEEDKGHIAIWRWHLVLNMSVQVIQTCAAMLLLLGLYQRKSKQITYWLFTTPIVALMEFTLLNNTTLHFFDVHAFDLDWFILNAITVLDDVYGWIVVYSYYQSILTPGAELV